MLDEGIVLELSEQTDIDINKIKCIDKIIDENSVITDEQIYLCEYLQKKYRIPLSATIRCN